MEQNSGIQSHPQTDIVCEQHIKMRTDRQHSPDRPPLDFFPWKHLRTYESHTCRKKFPELRAISQTDLTTWLVCARYVLAFFSQGRSRRLVSRDGLCSLCLEESLSPCTCGRNAPYHTLKRGNLEGEMRSLCLALRCGGGKRCRQQPRRLPPKPT